MAQSAPSRDLPKRARLLIDRLVAGYDPKYGYGSFSCAIYDSAWVSMVAKGLSDQRCWLFPESFHYILDHQMKDGGWVSYASEIDGILNTAASLLSLNLHMKRPLQITNISVEDLSDRSSRAAAALQALLQAWDVSATEHVGFEILVPTMLRLLKEEGFHFQFPGESLLKSIHEEKISRIDLTQLYKAEKTSILHSLEAFADMIDCTQFAHQKANGSIMASPSATSAYLICSNTWDDEAEDYLRHVVARTSNPEDRGGTPSAFPSTFFEYSWILSTLLEANFSIQTLGVDQVEQIGEILASALETEHGLVGFAPSVGSDADDTARVILTLNLLGRPTSLKMLVDTYEADNHFKTYSTERNASFSTNCNVLIALLHTGNVTGYVSQIEKATRFLCSSWWDSNDGIKDKWHLSPSYPTMLFVQALTRLLELWNDGLLSTLAADLIQDRIPIVLFQALIRTLQAQNPDGSWGNENLDRSAHEETAYSVLILARASSVVYLEPLRLRLMAAIDEGRKVLLSRDEKTGYLWVEKVSYRSDVLCESYCLAALNISIQPLQLGSEVKSLFAIPMEGVNKFTNFCSQLPLLAGLVEWRLQASLIEGHLFRALIERVHLDIFPRKNMGEDEFFEYIPSSWTGCNKLTETYVSNKLLYDMMVISLLNHQIHDYMETVRTTSAMGSIETIKTIVEDLFDESEAYFPVEHKPEVRNVKTNETSLRSSDAKAEENGAMSAETSKTPTDGDSITSEVHDHDTGIDSDTEELDEIRSTLKRLVDYVLRHPVIAQASRDDQTLLRTELRIFLLALITQTQDKAWLATRQMLDSSITVPFETPRSSSFDGARTTSAVYTSCPYSFAFVICLLRGTGMTCFETAEEKYLAQDLCRHLSNMCQMYSDLSSVLRDRAKNSVNSVNFPKLGADELECSENELKDRLWRLAMYEKECLDLAFARLERLAAGCKRKRRVLGVFKIVCNVMAFHGQIDVVKDVSGRMSGLELRC